MHALLFWSIFSSFYGGVQCYSRQRCSARIIAGNKHLSKKYPQCRFRYLHCLKISLCWYGHLWYPKILCVDLDHQSKSTNVDPNLKPMPFSLSQSLHSLSLPNSQHLVLSLCALCLIPHYVLPVLISHKKCMMLEYDYHCLTINDWGRTCCFTGNLLTIIWTCKKTCWLWTPTTL